MRNSLQLAVAAGLVALACIAGGCSPEGEGTAMMLGPTSQARAFETARMVMAQYFTLDEVDPQAGRITTQPNLIDSARFSVSDSDPDKQFAELTLRPDGKYVIARLSIFVQRRGSEALGTFGARNENYRGMPGQTPAELDGATTPKQNDTWQTYRYDHILEHTILRDLDRLLRPVEDTPQGMGPVLPR